MEGRLFWKEDIQPGSIPGLQTKFQPFSSAVERAPDKREVDGAAPSMATSFSRYEAPRVIYSKWKQPLSAQLDRGDV